MTSADPCARTSVEDVPALPSFLTETVRCRKAASLRLDLSLSSSGTPSLAATMARWQGCLLLGAGENSSEPSAFPAEYFPSAMGALARGEPGLQAAQFGHADQHLGQTTAGTVATVRPMYQITNAASGDRALLLIHYSVDNAKGFAWYFI